ncbi:MAG: NADH-quinone oxidoreductase subunit NuoG [Pseudomonadota bacterium]
MSEDSVIIRVNDEELEVPRGITVLQACELAGAEIPRFCYHDRLSIAGNCRMCLVEWVGAPKPQASCALGVNDLRPNRDGTPPHIRTDSETVKKAREGVMEFLLINHPLDCPICDQGGECDLQDQSMYYGRGGSRFAENTRAVDEKYMGPLIKTEMTRCIHCTRCVRFSEEVAGVEDIGAIYRGENMEITSYLEKAVASELSANVIDLCPVGALTSKPYAFKARPWELKKTEGIDVMDAVGSNIRVDSRGNEVMRFLPRLNEEINEEWISDKTRYVYDGLTKRRLDRPYVRRNGRLQPASWQDAFAAIKQRLSGLQGYEIAALAGDLQDVESMFALKALTNALGSQQTECRLDGAVLDASNRASYIFNTTIEGIEAADALLLVGTNPRTEAAIINARVLKATRHAGLKVYTIGPDVDLTYDAVHLGEDLNALRDLSEGKGEAFKAFAQAERPMIILGQGALARRDGQAVFNAAVAFAHKAGMSSQDWNGFNILHTAASRVGALDIGFVSNGGLSAITTKAQAGEIKAVFLAGVDEIDFSAFAGSFKIYMGTHGDAAARVADVILPGAAYTEKAGIYVNTEGRVQQAPRAIFPPGDAREDWTIVRALSDVLGKTLPFNTLPELRAALVAAHPHFEAMDEIVLSEGVPKPIGKSAVISAQPVELPVANFYLTNPIARASQTMHDCVKEVLGLAAEEGATGTDG